MIMRIIQKIYRWLIYPTTTAQIVDTGPGYVVINFETKNNLKGVIKRWQSKLALFEKPANGVKYTIGVDGHEIPTTVLPAKEVKRENV